jgi:hypothetical protein
MSRRAAAWIAWSLGILCAVLLAPTLLLFAFGLSHPSMDVFGLWWALPETAVAVTFPTLGHFEIPPLRDRHPHKPHPRLRCSHRGAGCGVLRRRGNDPGDLPRTHRSGAPATASHSRLHPRHSACSWCKPKRCVSRRHRVGVKLVSKSPTYPQRFVVSHHLQEERAGGGLPRSA